MVGTRTISRNNARKRCNPTSRAHTANVGGVGASPVLRPEDVVVAPSLPLEGNSEGKAAQTRQTTRKVPQEAMKTEVGEEHEEKEVGKAKSRSKSILQRQEQIHDLFLNTTRNLYTLHGRQSVD